MGKSTLFNRLTRTRAALVADFPGLTRDRHYGEGKVGDYPYIVIDTGGFEPVVKDGILQEMARQTRQAIDESDIVIFLVDARAGLNAHDHEIAALLRRQGHNAILAVNKAEGMRNHASIAEFYELGLGSPHPISASHGDGVAELINNALEGLGLAPYEHELKSQDNHKIKLAVAGRPNVGKSTFINAILGEERLVTFDMPGTTRDSIEVSFTRGSTEYTLIDTAGLRRKGRVFEAVEKFSVIKTLQAIEASNVVVLLLDGHEGVSDQDASIAGFILEAGRALVVAINKWDGTDDYQRETVIRDFNRKLRFLSFANMHRISAINGQGIGAVLRSVEKAHAAAFSKLSTPRLTRAIRAAVEEQPPPRKGMFRPKLRYAHQGGQNPPRVIVHGNALEAVPESYKRYLEARVREQFDLQGTPLRVEFKTNRNPYVRNK